MTEQRRKDVVVDEHFVRFGDKSYAINKITSVEVRARDIEKKGWVFPAVIGALFVLIGIARFTEAPLASAFSMIVGAVFLYGAHKAFQDSNTTVYDLYLVTSGAE